MAEILVQFETGVRGPAGRTYTPRACGRRMDDGRRWEGWIEFVPRDASPVLRTSRETVQPNRDDLRYWATGLSTTYLEGALNRALEPPPAVVVATAPARPTYEEPAMPVVHVSRDQPPLEPPQAVLDPFHVYAQGEEILRQELTALEPVHLRNIIRAYDLVPLDELDLQHLSRVALAELIVVAVQKRVSRVTGAVEPQPPSPNA